MGFSPRLMLLLFDRERDGALMEELDGEHSLMNYLEKGFSIGRGVR